MNQVKLFLVDDHRIFRQGLIELLQKNGKYQVIGQADNGRIALNMLDDVKPDIVFLDISMPELNGLDTAKIIVKKYPQIKIIILSMFDKSKFICEALSIGVSGYLLKDVDANELYSAVETVAGGKKYLSERINQQVIQGYVDFAQDRKYSSPIDSLSAREREVFQLIVEGYAGKEIASKLNISSKTVEHHRYKIYSKLACANATELVRLAIKEGIIDA